MDNQEISTKIDKLLQENQEIRQSMHDLIVAYEKLADEKKRIEYRQNKEVMKEMIKKIPGARQVWKLIRKLLK